MPQLSSKSKTAETSAINTDLTPIIVMIDSVHRFILSNPGGFKMLRRNLSIAEIGLISSTRLALGVGIGLLLSDKLTKDQRKGAGWALLSIGAATTVPLVMAVLGKEDSTSRTTIKAA